MLITMTDGDQLIVKNYLMISLNIRYSATAFHWIPEEIGYPKVIQMLKPHGTLALFWNKPFRLVRIIYYIRKFKVFIKNTDHQTI